MFEPQLVQTFWPHPQLLEQEPQPQLFAQLFEQEPQPFVQELPQPQEGQRVF